MNKENSAVFSVEIFYIVVAFFLFSAKVIVGALLTKTKQKRVTCTYYNFKLSMIITASKVNLHTYSMSDS